jgi:polar amino acid transport system permease protein
LELAVISSLVGTVLGFALGICLRFPVIGPSLRLLNDMLRAIPLLVLIFFFYYFPYLELFHIAAPGPFLTSAIALTLAQINFTGEIVRSAIDGVSVRTIDAAKSIGLKQWMIWWYVILPDVLRQILPTLVAFYIGNIKLSSLASVIGCEELVFNARLAVGMTFHSLEAWVLVAAVYIILVLPLTTAARQLERSEWLQRRS